MSEFNLVPEEFRAREKKRGALTMTGIALGAVLVLSGAAYLVVASLLDSRGEEVQTLRQQKALSMQQQTKLSELQRRKEKLQTDMRLLSSLRSGATMPELVAAIEQALPGDEVRFENWQFRRAGIRTEDEPEARPPSYFFITSEEKDFPKVWESMTHMTIQGVAKDHGALSRFVQRLFQQPNIDDVRIQRSEQGVHGVTFHVAVVVRSAEDFS